MTGLICRIERFAIHDGPGIRTTVFLKGCPLRCLWCHSPESQSPRPEFMPLPDRCIGCGSCAAACPQRAVANRPGGEIGEAINASGPGPRDVKNATLWGVTPEGCTRCGVCAEACPTGARVLVGEEMSVEAVVAAVERDRVFYDQSGGGVTLSGGEPLMQAPFVAALVEACRARRVHVAVDTAGFGDPRALDDIRPDLFLFDVKAIDEELHRTIAGVSNRVILENLARLAARARAGRAGTAGGNDFPASLIVRFPLVPGVNDSDDNVRAIGRVVSSLGIGRMDVLPYHRAGMAKYERLGKPYALVDTPPPTREQTERAAAMLSEAGLTVRVGGS